MIAEWTQLRQLVLDSYNLDELRTLCFDLGVRYDDLGGEGISGKVRELLLLLGRQRRLDDLLAEIGRARPDALAGSQTGLDAAALETLYSILIDDSRHRDYPSGLVVDTLDFTVRHKALCLNRSKGLQWGSEPLRAAPTLSLVLTNVEDNDSILVPRVEVLRRDTFEGKFCTFPNDPTTGALLDYYQTTVNLEDAGARQNVLPAPLQLKPTESFSLMVGFTGHTGPCYRIQLRAYWLVIGRGNWMTVLSDPYLINLAEDKTTWREQVREALSRGETVTARLVGGWQAFNDYLDELGAEVAQVIKWELEPGSPLGEFVLLGDRAVILPELPPKDRAIETFNENRRGVLSRDREMISKIRQEVEQRAPARPDLPEAPASTVEEFQELEQRIREGKYRAEIWYCIYCGWRNEPAEICQNCQRQRPVIDLDYTLEICRNCSNWNLADATYCEWCGEALRTASEPLEDDLE